MTSRLASQDTAWTAIHPASQLRLAIPRSGGGAAPGRLLARAAGALDLPGEVRLVDGTVLALGAGPPRFTVTFASQRAFRRLLRRPTALAVGEAFVTERMNVEGDVFEAMRALHRLDATPAPWWRRLFGTPPIAAGVRRRQRDVAFHYDVSNDFYALFLDPRMVYTCAYYREPEGSLATAQEDKLELVCRKLRLRPGERFLDLGCGWGALVLWAAERWQVEAHGITLSKAQVQWAEEAIRRAGSSARAHVSHRDWRTLPADPRWDKITAVGLIEHVGRRGLPAYFAHVERLLAPGGLFLNHGITCRPGAGWSSEMEFLSRHVFPGGELVDLGTTLATLERHGFEILDVENLRPHYARTTRQWVERLQANAVAARALVGERTYRTWIAYLAAASVAFEEGWIALHQVLCARRGDPAAPPTRENLYDGVRREPSSPDLGGR